MYLILRLTFKLESICRLIHFDVFGFGSEFQFQASDSILHRIKTKCQSTIRPGLWTSSVFKSPRSNIIFLGQFLHFKDFLGSFPLKPRNLFPQPVAELLRTSNKFKHLQVVHYINSIRTSLGRMTLGPYCRNPDVLNLDARLAQTILYI